MIDSGFSAKFLKLPVWNLEIQPNLLKYIVIELHKLLIYEPVLKQIMSFEQKTESELHLFGINLIMMDYSENKITGVRSKGSLLNKRQTNDAQPDSISEANSNQDEITDDVLVMEDQPKEDIEKSPEVPLEIDPEVIPVEPVPNRT